MRELRQRGRAIAFEKLSEGRARVKLAAKLLVIAWTLMKKREAFNPAYLNAHNAE